MLYKSTTIVEAFQMSDKIRENLDLIPTWAKSNLDYGVETKMTNARWIWVKRRCGGYPVNNGEYVVKDEDSDVYTMTKERFESKYEKVEEQMENCNNDARGCCPLVETVSTAVEPIAVPTQVDCESLIYQENVELQKKFADAEREQNRLRYMASGYTALILETKDATMIARAAEIASEANKLY